MIPKGGPTAALRAKGRKAFRREEGPDQIQHHPVAPEELAFGVVPQGTGSSRTSSDRDPVVKSQSAEPTISRIEVNLLAEQLIGPNAHATADDQHADHQLCIDRAAAHLAVERLQRLAEVIEGEMAVNAPEH